MDFSSPRLAVQSLLRRQPELDEDILELARDFLAVISTDDEKDKKEWISYTQQLLTGSFERWEPLAVGLYTSHVLLLHYQKLQEGVYMEGPRVPNVTATTISTTTTTDDTEAQKNSDLEELCKVLRVCMEENLEHDEPRIRTLVAKLVGSYSQYTKDESLFTTLLLPSLQTEMARGRDNNPDKKYSTASCGALDDTTGWRAVETHLQAIASYIHGGRISCHKEQQTVLYDICLDCCIHHVNRHVRAAGIQLLEQCCIHITNSTGTVDEELQTVVVEVLKDCLADNWSQVRMAACVLCRSFLLKYPEQPDKIWRVLLPRMCLNRFYLAQGVKLYSLETWKLVFPQRGLELVAKYAGAVCQYYIKGCDADNHVVREAACQAVAELAHKVGHHPTYAPSLTPYISMLLQALIMCFHDESWPVRDEACLACGIFCLAYPNEAQPELPTLMERWKEHLTDQIWSVRQDAAIALGNVIRAYGNGMADEVWTLIEQNMTQAYQQPKMTQQEYERRQNDIDQHTDSQLYSCGSLAPKLKKKAGAGRIGCSSCAVNRPKQAWEASDGAIYLLREYIGAMHETTTDSKLMPMIETMMNVCRVSHFPQGNDLRMTLWRCWPCIAQSLGKRRFKQMYLEITLDPLLQNAQHGSPLSIHAAEQCIVELSNFVGLSIFRHRLPEESQRRFVDELLLREQQHNSHTRHEPMDMFSPFGPPPTHNPVVSPSPPKNPYSFGTLPNVPGNEGTETF